MSGEFGAAEGGSGRWQKSSLLHSYLLVLILDPVPSFFPLCCAGGTVCTVTWKNRLVVWFRWGKKGEKVSVVVGLYFQMDLLSSVVYHVATHTRTKRLVRGWEQVESGAAETLLTLEMILQTTLPRHKNVAITELRRCVSELTLFPDSRDKLHWFHWRRVWQQRAVIWWKADPGRSSSHCVWNSANKRERAKNVLEIGLQ